MDTYPNKLLLDRYIMMIGFAAQEVPLYELQCSLSKIYVYGNIPGVWRSVFVASHRCLGSFMPRETNAKAERFIRVFPVHFWLCA